MLRLNHIDTSLSSSTLPQRTTYTTRRFHPFCAQGGTRTPTPLRATPPQGVMSTNFNTWAYVGIRLKHCTRYSLFAPSSTVSADVATASTATSVVPFIMRVRRNWRRASRETFSRIK